MTLCKDVKLTMTEPLLIKIIENLAIYFNTNKIKIQQKKLYKLITANHYKSMLKHHTISSIFYIQKDTTQNSNIQGK